MPPLKAAQLTVWTLAIVVFAALFPLPLWAQATLENPQPGSFQSGLGIISGWVCEANRIEIQFDDQPLVEAAYGTDRGDTQSACGDTNNGFGLLFNWNLLNHGVHTVRALADGVEFARATITVTRLSEKPFLPDLRREVRVADFPEAGTDVVLRWQEQQQNFVITDGSPGQRGGTSGSPPRVLENPQPGSFQSGLGIISGWVCEANRIEIQFDDQPLVEAAYGTDRGDTQSACGDTNNGFGLLFNWNLLNHGVHTVRALADGVEFARATITVTRLSEKPFLPDLRREVRVADFPEAGTDVVLRWQEQQQNFVIAQVTGPHALIRSGEAALASGNLSNAHEHFRQALESAPGNPQANLYSAITRIATPTLTHPDLRSLASRSGVAVTGDSSDVCALSVDLPEQVPSSAPRTGAIIQAFREVLLPEIATAIESLNRIASTAEVRFDLMNLPDCLRSRLEDFGIEQAEVEIDRSDIQALTATLQLAQAAFEIAAAYDLDADLQLVTTQTSRAILDAEPRMLNLRSSAPLTTARNLIEQALMKADMAIESVLAETDDQSDDVIEVLPEDASDARLVQDTLESVRQSLRGRVTLPADLGFDDPERLDLRLLFSGRFGTLRPFIPVFDSGCRTMSSSATLGGTLTHRDQTSLFRNKNTLGTFLPLGRFPDPTFGGTTPDLTQQNINDQLLKWESHYADCYTFSGSTGQSVSLRVQSPAFDTVLVLIGPDGRIVDDNDDCFGDRPNSCLPYDILEGGRLSLPSSGSYTVEVSSYFAEEGGDYTLTIGR